MKKFFMIAAASILVLAACNSKKESGNEKKEGMETSTGNKQERNKKVVMASMESFNKNDFDGVLKEAAPSFMDYADGSVPPMSNIDSLKGFFKMIKDAVPDYKGENIMYLADGDHVAVIADWTGTFKNDLMGMKATGKTFKFKDVDIFTLNDDGKITEHRSIANFGAVLMATAENK